MGMQTVWVFGDTADILRLPKPQVQGYLTYGGSKHSRFFEVRVLSLMIFSV